MGPMSEEDFFKTAPVFGGDRAPSAPGAMPYVNPSEEEFFKSTPQYQQPAQNAGTTPAIPIGPSPAVDKAMHLTTGRPEPEDIGWGEVASGAISNIPKSAVEFGKGLVQPFLQPVETAQTIGQLGKGLYSKGRGLLGYDRDLEAEKTADVMGQFFKERYGSMPAIKRTIKEDPVAAAADLASVLTLGGGAAARAPGMLGTLGQAAKTVGTAVDPISIATKAPALATKAISPFINYPLSLHSGASYKSLQAATEAGLNKNPVFMEHLTGAVPPTDLINRINNGISTVAKQRSDEYLAGMGRIASNQTLPFDKVDDALKAARDIAYHKGSPRGQGLVDTFQQMQNIVNEWRNNPQMTHNIADFDALKQRLRKDGYSSTFKGSPERKIVDTVAEAAKATIPDDRYVKIMENYQAATQELIDLTKELTARGGSSAAQIRKILKSQDTKAKGDLIKRLEAIDPNLPYAIAGVELHSWIPQGLRGQIAGALSTGAFGGLPYLAMHPAPLAGMALASPRITGATSYGIGRVGGLPENLRQRYPALAPALFQSGRAEEVAGQASGGRIERANGGRINPEMMADKIIGQIEKARKELQSQTGQLLNHDDETIVKALKVANERI